MDADETSVQVDLSAARLRDDAEQIWRAGVAAVAPNRLIRGHLVLRDQRLRIDKVTVDLREIRRIVIVGGGKASGAMAVALERVLEPALRPDQHMTGWVNVPADCIVPTKYVRLHAGRPASVNEPRPEGMMGTQQILQLVSSLGPSDLCFCLISGGGSALLPAPPDGISLDDKILATRMLSQAGANIKDLNTVRRELSLVKGGGLAAACRAGRLISLLISDVPGDELGLIASGPTVPRTSTPATAIDVLRRFGLSEHPILNAVNRYLEQRVRNVFCNNARASDRPSVAIYNAVIGNNETASRAAGLRAMELGYRVVVAPATSQEGSAESVGAQIAESARRLCDSPGASCYISGGEPTVALVEESRRGKGGRNVQLALAALSHLRECTSIAFLSAGTDGEDGPTNAAGAVVTAEVVRTAQRFGLNAKDYLARNDAYSFFYRCGGLFVTGPTQANVCDLRVVTVRGSN